ncbi:FAD-binding oxidoreductase [Alkalilimnicola ehrlichii]|uniref:FAD-binding oxidoreductase n=1 Tax=Alkalilimnicola ehrlichii TaxID=351052 RepID=UPI001C6ECFC4|nr:FAD-binding oxidoreductase [Alkalilimnicola ehrlichii]
MTDLRARLAEVLPHEEFTTDPEIIASYAHDQAGLCNSGTAAALVRARSVDTVIATLRLATATRTPVVTRGAGTGLSGGANAVDGCIILALHKLDRILELDPVAGIARVEPGVLNGTLNARAREHGLTYAPDPASRAICSIGGNVATNAGGACCVKYGVTGDHVACLEAILADGSRIRTGSLTRKNVAGLDLNRLLIGSEGTLAVIVGITVRLLPAPRPAAR